MYAFLIITSDNEKKRKGFVENGTFSTPLIGTLRSQQNYKLGVFENKCHGHSSYPQTTEGDYFRRK